MYHTFLTYSQQMKFHVVFQRDIITGYFNLESFLWGTHLHTKATEGHGRVRKMESSHIIQTHSFISIFSTYFPTSKMLGQQVN